MARSSRPSKKLRQDACGTSRGRDAQAEDRDLVPGRGPHRPEERPCPTMGQAGTRPFQPADQRYESAYLFGAICPARGVGAGLALPFADTDAMQLHLDEISLHVARDAHAVLLLDRAGWHTTGNLVWPRNITPILLPSRSPESTRSSRSGNTCAPTSSQTASSRPTTTSLRLPATHGTGSSQSPTPSHQSECANGPIRVSYEARSVVPFTRSRIKTSLPPLLSPSTKLSAIESNVI